MEYWGEAVDIEELVVEKKKADTFWLCIGTVLYGSLVYCMYGPRCSSSSHRNFSSLKHGNFF
jgi:hypothetical protein